VVLIGALDDEALLLPAQAVTLPKTTAWFLLAEFAGTLFADELEVDKNVFVDLVLDGEGALTRTDSAPLVTLTTGNRRCISVRQILLVDDTLAPGCEPTVTHNVNVRIRRQAVGDSTVLPITLRGMLTITASKRSETCGPPCY
jgi:hypothetical protein